MCEPLTAIAVASAVGGTLLTGAGQMQTANANAAALKYNSQVSEMNAVLADRRAKDAIERGQREEQRKRLEIAQLKGRQIAALSDSGVDIGFGSPLDTIVDTAVLGELDALTIRSNAAREAYEYKVQGVNARADAALSRANAQSAKTSGYLTAGGTILGGGARAYEGYNRSTIGTFR